MREMYFLILSVVIATLTTFLASISQNFEFSVGVAFIGYSVASILSSVAVFGDYGGSTFTITIANGHGNGNGNGETVGNGNGGGIYSVFGIANGNGNAKSAVFRNNLLQISRGTKARG